jgi:cytochrome c oxidase assembly protein subunit 15
MRSVASRISTLRKVAWACAAVVLVIVSLSAFIRLSRAGLGCEPWPECYAQHASAVVPSAVEKPDGPVTAARLAHRIVAVAALLLIIWMVMTAFASNPVMRREGRMALALLALALFLAILGRWTSDARLPAVMLGNLLGGFAMFAVSWRLARSAGRPPDAASHDRLARWARIGAALLVMQIVLGGLVSAGHAGLSCPRLPACDTTAGSWVYLNPLHEMTVAATDPTNPAGSLVHYLHRAGTLVVAAVLLPLGVAAWRRGRRAGGAVVVLLALQAALGALLVITHLALPVALAHNMAAAVLLVAVLALAHPRERRPAINQPD